VCGLDGRVRQRQRKPRDVPALLKQVIREADPHEMLNLPRIFTGLCVYAE
jgi:hypothetical protein